jgi:hypothetical protein
MCPLKRAVEGGEAELLPVGALGPKVEAREPQQARDDLLAAVSRLEDPQGARLEVAARVLRDRQVVVLDLAQAGAAESSRADVGAWCLRLLAGEQCPVDRRADQGGSVRQRDGIAILAARAVVEVDHWGGPKMG